MIEVKKDGVIASKYVYDSNGNRLMRITTNDLMTNDTTFAAYDEQDRLFQYGNDKFVYNKNGYMTAKVTGNDTTKYTYDNLGNLLLVNLPNGSTLEYIVDANNRRIAKKVNGNVVKKWLYSGELTPIAELDSTGNITSRFVYATKSNTPDYIVKGDTTYKIISDHLGSVRLIINVATGEIKQQIKYDEFGNVLSQSGSIELPFGYAGGMYDAQTKLVRFGARDYSATIGRWTAKDPILFEGGDYNLYGYVINDPINQFDITGTSWQGNLQLAFLGLATSVSQSYLQGARGWELGVSAIAGFASGMLGGVAFGEKASFFVGAVVGGVSNIIGQVAAGTPIKDIKVGSVLGSAVTGSIFGGGGTMFPAEYFYEKASLIIMESVASFLSNMAIMDYYMSQEGR